MRGSEAAEAVLRGHTFTLPYLRLHRGNSETFRNRSGDPRADLEELAMAPTVPAEKASAMETDTPREGELEDLYTKLKTLQRQLEFVDIQEEYIKDETKNLRRELLRAQEEVKRIQSVPLVIGQFLEMVDANSGIVGSTTGSNYYVRILSTLNRELLKPSASVALHRHSNALVDILPPEADSSISLLAAGEKPDVSYTDIGGADIQKQEIREAVELPLTHHELYRQIGIDPPRGVLLYGPPGTGKTMLAKAVAHHTTAAFIRVVGSEPTCKVPQKAPRAWHNMKYARSRRDDISPKLENCGDKAQLCNEGPRMVRDVFRLAKENAPAIIFIDEIDAIATARFDAQTGADREAGISHGFYSHRMTCTDINYSGGNVRYCMHYVRGPGKSLSYHSCVIKAVTRPLVCDQNTHTRIPLGVCVEPPRVYRAKF
eukprot:1193727-Prorocentrum_minimum.AAC.7